MTIDTLFNNELSQYASYDNIRSIVSVVDGLKNSGRKVVYFSKDLEKYKKVSTLKSEISAKSQYLHNEDILPEIIVGFARDFNTSNQLPLFKALSAVGCRTKPVAAQPRYSSVKKSDFYDLIFNSKDEPILIHQSFENSYIEPRYLLPTLPLVLLMNSNGMGVGFASKIFSRKLSDVIDVIKKYLDGEDIDDCQLFPYFKGYKGEIELLAESDGKKQWKFRGTYKKVDSYNLIIDEVPPFYTNEYMLEILNTLKDKKIIKSYKDHSIGDKFEYHLNVASIFWENSNIHKLLGIETTDTENFTCIDDNNYVKVYKDEIEILKKYIDVKLMFMNKRKDYELAELSKKLSIISDKVKFIQAVLDKKVIFERNTKENIIKQINQIGITNNIDILINMPLYSLSDESIKKLNLEKDKIKYEYDVLKKTSINQLWINDINKIIGLNIE